MKVFRWSRASNPFLRISELLLGYMEWVISRHCTLYMWALIDHMCTFTQAYAKLVNRTPDWHAIWASHCSNYYVITSRNRIAWILDRLIDCGALNKYSNTSVCLSVVSLIAHTTQYTTCASSVRMMDWLCARMPEGNREQPYKHYHEKPHQHVRTQQTTSQHQPHALERHTNENIRAGAHSALRGLAVCLSSMILIEQSCFKSASVLGQ